MDDPKVPHNANAHTVIIDPLAKDHNSKPTRTHSHPGLNETESTAHALHYMGPGDEDEEIGYYQPTLWWFTSTVFPLIAGTFGPLANLFSICALVQTWRVTVPDDKRVPDPPWLLVLNIISLTLALPANLLLFFNFARRVSYHIAQPLTIILWYLACILLIIPLTLCHTVLLTHHPSYILSESYYCALIAAVLYLIISTLLLFNVLGTTPLIHAYPPTLGSLTIPQRTLMLQTISFSCYLALGAGVFSTIEGWGFVDGLYWADYTLLTIGFGSDFPLKKTLARMLLFPYAAVGTTSVGLIVNSVRGLVLERGKARITQRRLGKEREKWEVTLIRDQDSNADDGSGGGLCLRMRSMRQRKKPFKVATDIKDDEGHPHRVWGKEEFELMRYIEQSAKRSQQYIALISSIVVFALVWGGGAIVFWACEREANWTYPESLYFTYVAILTIGYGDFYPSTNAARPFFVIWSLIAVPAMTVFISVMGETIIKWIEEATVWLGRRSILPEREGVKKKRRGREKMGWRRVWPGGGAVAADNTVASREEHGKPSSSGDIEETKRSVGDTTTTTMDVGEDAALIVRLAKEITQVARDASTTNGVASVSRYEWEEWVRWLEMMEEVGRMVGHEGVVGRRRLRDDEEEGGRSMKRKWTWLDDEGPLFSPDTETQWVLGRLCRLLEKLSERGRC